MPSETGPQDRVWMAFPTGGYTLGDTEKEAHAARSTWAAVANAILEFEPVTMVVSADDVDTAARYLDPRVEVVTAELNDAWMRDIGPSFVLDSNKQLGAVDWIFNGWGAQDWAEWDKDSLIAEDISRRANAQHLPSGIVNEGGGIQVDGEGTVLVTETVQLDQGRNPGLTKADIEQELARTIGATHVVWLPRGLTRDSEKFGTRGHVDIVAAIPSPGTLLVHSQQNPEHPDYKVSREIIDFLRTTHDAAGRDWNIIEVPAPVTLSDDEGFVDYSYINHLVVNGGVIACTFNDPMDEKALRILADAYPGRRVVGVDARELFARGGGIHCITQQQPSAI
ncbi:agmatine deiminase family protein [Arthrobacter sp. D3-18]